MDGCRGPCPGQGMMVTEPRLNRYWPLATVPVTSKHSRAVTDRDKLAEPGRYGPLQPSMARPLRAVTPQNG